MPFEIQLEGTIVIFPPQPKLK